MKVSPLMFNTIYANKSFKQKFDLGDELNKAINKKLHNDDTDSFVPSTPSQPIIIEKLEINQQNDKESSSKNNSGSSFLTGTGTGFVGSEVTDKIIEKRDENSQKGVDIDKMIDETANENKESHEDMSIQEMAENDDFDTTDTDDTDSDTDIGDDDE